MNIFDLWDHKICNVGQFWLCMAVAGLAFLAGWKTHDGTLLENQREQQILETRQEIVEVLGEEWADAQIGDLIRWKESGHLQIMSNVVSGSGIDLKDFGTGFSTSFNFPVYDHPYLAERVILIKRGHDTDNPDLPNPGYLLALDEFVQQQFGKRE